MSDETPHEPNDCGCTDPDRLGNGKVTRVYIDGAPVWLCQGCAMDRRKEWFTASWGGWRDPVSDYEQKAYDRGSNAIKSGGFGESGIKPKFSGKR